LRRRLAGTPFWIETVWGRGLCLRQANEGEVALGAVETGIAPPVKSIAAVMPSAACCDRYGLAQLALGESRRLQGADLKAVRQACYDFNHNCGGRFFAAAEGDAIRVWRAEKKGR
jgi:hypothetical protein